MYCAPVSAKLDSSQIPVCPASTCYHGCLIIGVSAVPLLFFLAFWKQLKIMKNKKYVMIQIIYHYFYHSSHSHHSIFIIIFLNFFRCFNMKSWLFFHHFFVFFIMFSIGFIFFTIFYFLLCSPLDSSFILIISGEHWASLSKHLAAWTWTTTQAWTWRPSTWSLLYSVVKLIPLEWCSWLVLS